MDPRHEADMQLTLGRARLEMIRKSAVGLLIKVLSDADLQEFYMDDPETAFKILDFLLEGAPDKYEDIAKEILENKDTAVVSVMNDLGKDVLKHAGKLDFETQLNIFCEKDLCDQIEIHDLGDEFATLIQSWDAGKAADEVNTYIEELEEDQSTHVDPQTLFLCLYALSFSEDPEHKAVLAQALEYEGFMWGPLDKGYDDKLITFIEVLNEEDQRIIIDDDLRDRFVRVGLGDQVKKIVDAWGTPGGTGVPFDIDG